MWRASMALVCTCLVIGCSTPDPIGLPQSIDRGIDPTDAVVEDQMVSDAQPMDSGRVTDAGPSDAGRADSGSFDAGVLPSACSTIHSDAVPIALPAADQVTAAYGGALTYLAWADANGVHQCSVGQSGTFEGERVSVETPEFEVTRMVSLRTSGTTWVAYGAPDQAIRLYQAHRPQETLATLDRDGRALFGAPLLADAGGSIMVIGRTAEGGLGWLVVPNDLSDRQVYTVDTAGFDMPGSAGATLGGVYLRFDDAGQCLFIADGQWNAAGSLPCQNEAGELLSNGERSILWHLEQRGDFFITLQSLYDPDGLVRIAKYDVADLTAMDVYRGHKPLIGFRNVPFPEERNGQTQLYLAGTNGVWLSRETWGSGWPWGDMRAIALAELPERAGDGTCGADGIACSTDLDCCAYDDPNCDNEPLCTGAAEAMHALVFRFRTYGRPDIEYVPLAPMELSDTATLFDTTALCAPTPEVCDGRDQDCDGFIDDGICCPSPDSNVELTGTFTTDGPITEFLLGDVEWKDAFILSFRQENEDQRSEWRSIRFKYIRDGSGTLPIDLSVEAVRDCNQPNTLCIPQDDSRATVRYATDAAYMNGIGGTRAFVAKTPPDHPTPGRWGVHWLHWTRDLKGDAENPVLLPEECDQIMAVEGLRRVDEGESVVIVCRDRIYRSYAKSHDDTPGAINYPDQEWLFSDEALGRINTIEWATINRKIVQSTEGNITQSRHDSAFTLLVAFRSSINDIRLKMYDFVTGSDAPPRTATMPDIFSLATDADKAFPIYLHQQLAGPPIRITDTNQAQAAFTVRPEEGDAYLEWRDLVMVAEPEKTVYSILNNQVISGSPVTDENGTAIGYAHWLVNTLSQDRVYNFWSTAPISVEEHPIAFWGMVHADYSHTLVKVRPTNDAQTEWELSATEFDCRAPQ